MDQHFPRKMIHPKLGLWGMLTESVSVVRSRWKKFLVLALLLLLPQYLLDPGHGAFRTTISDASSVGRSVSDGTLQRRIRDCTDVTRNITATEDLSREFWCATTVLARPLTHLRDEDLHKQFSDLAASRSHPPLPPKAKLEAEMEAAAPQTVTWSAIVVKSLQLEEIGTLFFWLRMARTLGVLLVAGAAQAAFSRAVDSEYHLVEPTGAKMDRSASSYLGARFRLAALRAFGTFVQLRVFMWLIVGITIGLFMAWGRPSIGAALASPLTADGQDLFNAIGLVGFSLLWLFLGLPAAAIAACTLWILAGPVSVLEPAPGCWGVKAVFRSAWLVSGSKLQALFLGVSQLFCLPALGIGFTLLSAAILQPSRSNVLLIGFMAAVLLLECLQEMLMTILLTVFYLKCIARRRLN